MSRLPFHQSTDLRRPTAAAQPTALASRRPLLAGAAFIAIATAFGFMAGSALNPPRAQNAATAPAIVSQSAAQPGSFADVVETVRPAVVSVRVKLAQATNRDGADAPALGMPDLPPGHPMERFFRRFGEQGEQPAPRRRQAEGQGSGFFISADGFVVTNNHVVAGASAVTIVTDDGRTLDARVVGTDPRTDLAVLKVDGVTDAKFVRFTEGQPRVGDWVVAIGNPFGLGGTVTAGIVSARGRDIGAGPYDDFLQIDAAVNRGNSGGPTFNLKGEVVGVNTAIFSPSGGNVGIAFAVPASTAQGIVARIRDTGSIARGFIGVDLQPLTTDLADALGLKEPKGALVASVRDGGAAAAAGVRAGDAIVAIDGTPVTAPRDLARRIGDMVPGATARLTLKRKGEERVVSLTLGKLPAPVEAPRRG